MVPAWRARRERLREQNRYREALEERIRGNPRDPDALFALAAFLALENKLRKAIAVLNELAKTAPDYPGLWRFKARLYSENGDSKLASVCAARGEASD